MILTRILDSKPKNKIRNPLVLIYMYHPLWHKCVNFIKLIVLSLILMRLNFREKVSAFLILGVIYMTVYIFNKYNIFKPNPSFIKPH